MKRSYTAARGMLGFVEVLGWLVVVGGILAAIATMTDRKMGLGGALMIGPPTILAGLLMVAIVQIARAQIDTAENTGESVELLRQLVRGQQVAPQDHGVTPGSEAGSNNAPSHPDGHPAQSSSYSVGPQPLVHNGVTIRKSSTGVGYTVGTMPFLTLAAAKAHIDAQQPKDGEV